MNKSIVVGIVALGLAACSGGVEDQPTDAVTAEAPAAEATTEVVEVAPADAAAPAEGVSATVEATAAQ